MKKLLLVLLFLLFASQVEATQTWVSATGGSTAAAAPGGCASASGATDPGTYFRTIVGALACYGTAPGGGAGHTVIVKNGSYTDHLDQAIVGDWLPKGSGSSWSGANVFTLKAETRAVDGGNVRLDQGSNRLLRLCPATGTNFFAVIDGFLFDWTTYTSNENAISLSCSDSGANYVRLQYNVMRNMRTANMLYFGAASHKNESTGLVTTLQDGNNIDIFYNKFYGGDLGSAAGCCGYQLYANGYHQRIIGNEFYNFPAYAIHVNNQTSENTVGGQADEWVIDSNYIHDWFDQRTDGGYYPPGYPGPGIIFNDAGRPQSDTMVIGQPPPSRGNPVGSRIINNIFSRGPHGVEFRNTRMNVTVANNTFNNMNGPDGGGSPPSGRAVLVWSDTSVRNNIFTGGTQPYVGPSAYLSGWTFNSSLISFNFCENPNTTSTAQSGCSQTGNPQFASGSGADAFKLQSGSAAINNGTNVSAFIGCSVAGGTCRDYAGVVRPQDGAWDIGAFEYVPTVIISPQLVLALPLDEGTATTAVDVSGQKNNATLVGGATWDNAGKYGKAVALDGTGYLNIPASASLALAPGMTLEMWVYPTTQQSVFSTLFRHGQDRYYLYASSDPGFCSALSGAPVGGYFTTANNIVCATSMPPVNNWSHLAVTYNGSTLTFYLNGNPVASQPSTNPMVQASSEVRLGNSLFGESFIGKIDEPRIYNYARSPTQIVSDMNTPLIAPPGKYVEIAAPTSVEISAASTLEIGAD